MPLSRLASNVLGVVTISLIAIVVILGLFCIIYSVYFRSRIRTQGLLHLGYFNGPWIARIALTVLAIWWGFGEIIRLSLLKGEGRFFTTPIWQKAICKFYIISNIGFAEPSLFLILMFLLHASLQNREHGALSRRWNTRVACYTLLFCLPMFLVQLVLVFVGSKFNNEEKDLQKMQKYFTSSSSWTGDNFTCTYPLMSTIALGFFYFVLISYISYVGFSMVRSVINKGLQRRIYFLIISIVSFLPLRVCLLGISVIPHPGGLLYEAIVFLAFLVLLFCVSVGVCMLVYYPVADSLALRNQRYFELEETPFDDYFDGASSLIVNQSHLETGRNSDASMKRGSTSFRTMLKDEIPSTDGFGEAGFVFSPATPINSSPREFRPLRSPVRFHGILEH